LSYFVKQRLILKQLHICRHAFDICHRTIPGSRQAFEIMTMADVRGYLGYHPWTFVPNQNYKDFMCEFENANPATVPPVEA